MKKLCVFLLVIVFFAGCGGSVGRLNITLKPQ